MSVNRRVSIAGIALRSASSLQAVGTTVYSALRIVGLACGLLAFGFGSAPETQAEPESSESEPADEDGSGEPIETDLKETVEVRAALPEPDDVAAFATTIDASRIPERGEDLADVLRRVPGARVRDYGGLGRYATVSLRASTAEQVTVLVDGVPQNRALGGPVDLSSIPATQLDRVTVFRGFAPASLGQGGIGGVVDVRTRAPGPEPEGRIDLVAGELDTARLSTGWSFRAGSRGSVRLGGEALTSEGDFVFLDPGATPFDPGDDRLVRRSNNDLQQGALLAQGVWSTGPGELRAAARFQRRDRGVPGLDNFQSESAWLEEALDDLNLSWSWRGAGTFQGADLQVDRFEQQIDYRDLDGDLGVGVQDQTTRLTGGGLSALFRVAPGRHRLQLRADLRHERATVRDRALAVQDRGGADRDLFALTAEDLLVFGRLTMAPSLRWEYRKDEFHAGGAGTIPPPADDVGDGNWSGKLGLAHVVGPHTTVRGSAGRFHRNPSMLELFGDRGAVVGNPALRPERGIAAELGLIRQWDLPRFPIELEVVGFGRDVEDLILLIPNSQATAVAQNISGAEVYGLEAAISVRAPHGLSLGAGGTLQRAIDRSGTFPDGKPLVYQPETLGFLGLAWDHGHYHAKWDATYVGSNSSDRLDTPALRMPSRVLHDLALTYQFRGGLKLGLDVRNLFDRLTRDVARYPLPDRVVLLYVGWGTGGGKKR